MEKRIVVNLTDKHGGAFTLEERQGSQEYYVPPGELATWEINYDVAESGDEFIAIVEESSTPIGSSWTEQPQRPRIIGLQAVRNDTVIRDSTYEVISVFADRTRRPHDWILILGGKNGLTCRDNIVNGGLVLTIPTKSLPEALRLERMIHEFAAMRWKKEMAPPQVFLRSVVMIRKSFLIDPNLVEEAKQLPAEPLNIFAASYGIEPKSTRLTLPPIAVEAQQLRAAPERRLPGAVIDVPNAATTFEVDERGDQELTRKVIDALNNGPSTLDGLAEWLCVPATALRRAVDRAVTEGRVREDDEGVVHLV